MVRDQETRSHFVLARGWMGDVIQYHQVLSKREEMSERQRFPLRGSGPPFPSPCIDMWLS